jgi:hypothetical protein
MMLLNELFGFGSKSKSRSDFSNFEKWKKASEAKHLIVLPYLKSFNGDKGHPTLWLAFSKEDTIPLGDFNTSRNSGVLFTDSDEYAKHNNNAPQLNKKSVVKDAHDKKDLITFKNIFDKYYKNTSVEWPFVRF